MKFKNIVSITIGMFAIVICTSSDVNRDKKEATLVGAIKEILDAYHFSPQAINDSVSAKTFEEYLKDLDYSKSYLTQSDYNALATYKYLIDDEIRNKTFDFFNLSMEIIENRMKNAKTMCDKILEQPFKYNIVEGLNIDPEDSPYAKDEQELYDIWRKTLKHQTIVKLQDLEQVQKKAHEKNDTVVLKSFDELEIEARAKVKKIYDSRFKYLFQVNRDDRFAMYINAIIGNYDPHTNYFPPKDKEDFDISISGQLEGIGATLSSKDGYIKVEQIVPGSASWRQGELKAEDIILKVAQGDNEPVDIVDMRLDEAVKLIRGPKGTKVVLTVKKIDGTIQLIPIIRDVVILEETFAKSVILTDEKQSKRIGYIYLPKFYIDFNNANGRKCSDDIKAELQKLKKQNVDGVIFDLRNNGGGSLQDVVKIGGFFVKKGPIVQVKQKNASPEILADNDTSLVYNGPLIIMVNTFSASASEILAAAMQDYKRAVIVGTKSSFGKGTVQRFVEIDNYLPRDFNDIKPLGDLKITIQKFYRINGGTTQLVGVTPDIILPDKYAYVEIGEKESKTALPWDEIPAVSYEQWKKSPDVGVLQKKSQKRQVKDSLLLQIEEASKALKTVRDKKTIPLEYTMHNQEEEKNKEISKFINKVGQTKTSLTIIPIPESVTITNNSEVQDTLKRQRIKDWHESLQKDAQLKETFNIMLDMQ